MMRRKEDAREKKRSAKIRGRHAYMRQIGHITGSLKSQDGISRVMRWVMQGVLSHPDENEDASLVRHIFAHWNQPEMAAITVPSVPDASAITEGFFPAQGGSSPGPGHAQHSPGPRPCGTNGDPPTAAA